MTVWSSGIAPLARTDQALEAAGLDGVGDVGGERRAGSAEPTTPSIEATGRHGAPLARATSDVMMIHRTVTLAIATSRRSAGRSDAVWDFLASTVDGRIRGRGARLEVDEVIDVTASDKVVVRQLRREARGKASGASSSSSATWILVDLPPRKVRSRDRVVYRDRAETALEAAGLEE